MASDDSANAPGGTVPSSAAEKLSPEVLESLCNEFERLWREGMRPRLDEFLTRCPAADRGQLFFELLCGELFYREKAGERPAADDYLSRFGEFQTGIAEAFQQLARKETISGFQDPHLRTRRGDGKSEPEPPDAGDLQAGDRLGNYQLLKKLGEGGMGAVYQARHVKLRKTVALKILPKHLTSNSAAVARFEREMSAIGVLEHPNIVRAYDANIDRGVHYLVMEYFDGEDVARKVREIGPLPVPLALNVLRQAALGLAHAHENGLVHRDIKPSNLLWTTRDEIKVLDLGLARLLDDQVHELTATGQILGTPDYMAPEQWESTHHADVRADLYALGCTLHFLLTGRAPFFTEGPRSTGTIFKAHLLQPPPDLTHVRKDVPAAVNLLFQRLMAKDPAERVQTAAELVCNLDGLLASLSSTPESRRRGEPFATIAEPESALVRFFESQMTTRPDVVAKPVSRRRSWPFVLAGGTSALFFLAVIAIAMFSRDGSQQQLKVPVEPTVKVAKADHKRDEPLLPAWASRKPPDYAKERAVAEWVLAAGGQLRIAQVGKPLKFITTLPSPGNLFTVHSISFRRPNSVTDGDLNRLRDLSALEFFTIQHNAILTDQAADALATQRSLKGITLNCKGVTDRTMDLFARMPDLERLNLDSTAITGVGVAKLVGNRKLTSLGVSSIPVSMPHLRALSGMPLRELHVSGTQVQYADLKELASLFPRLELIDVRNLVGHYEAGLASLAQLPGLRQMFVDPQHIVGGDPHPLSTFPKLQRLYLINESLSTGVLPRLAGVPQVDQLDLVGCTLDSAALQELTVIPTIRRLRLSQWNVNDADLLKIAAMPALKEIVLEWTYVTSEGVQQFRAARPDVSISGDFEFRVDPATATTPSTTD